MGTEQREIESMKWPTWPNGAITNTNITTTNTEIKAAVCRSIHLLLEAIMGLDLHVWLMQNFSFRP